MNKLSKILTIVFGFGVFGFALSLIPSHRQVNAATTIPVTVENPTTNPVRVLSIDQPWDHPFVEGCSAASSATTAASCTFTVPSGEKVVMKLLTIRSGADPTNTRGTFALDVFTGGVEHDLFEETTDSGIHQPNNSNLINTSAYELQLDAGSTVQCTWQSPAVNPVVGLTGSCSISGYNLTE
jgi:hypothetical protein